MRKKEDLDRVLGVLKRLQRRFYFADYADLELRELWSRTPADAPYEEHVFPVAPDRAALKEILIFKPDEIGDAIVALPAIVALKKAVPGARISLICQKVTAPLMERTGLFDAIAPIEVKMRFLRVPTFSIDGALAALPVKRFDLAVFLRTYPSYFKAFKKLPADRLLHPLDPRMPSKSPYQARVSLWGRERKHQALQMREIVAPLVGSRGDFASLEFPEMNWTARDREALAGLPEKFGVVHPFNRYETRRYPMDYWKPLLEGLKMPWVVVGGKDDTGLPPIENAIRLEGKLDLTQTAYLISRASAFIGTDSGPAHLAGMFGVPTINIRGGQASATEWAPLGRRSLVLRADMPCAPCHRRVCPGMGLRCLTEMTPDKVLPLVASFLAHEREGDLAGSRGPRDRDWQKTPEREL